MRAPLTGFRGFSEEAAVWAAYELICPCHTQIPCDAPKCSTARAASCSSRMSRDSPQEPLVTDSHGLPPWSVHEQLPHLSSVKEEEKGFNSDISGTAVSLNSSSKLLGTQPQGLLGSG